jgi:hypothetical protein
MHYAYENIDFQANFSNILSFFYHENRFRNKIKDTD